MKLETKALWVMPAVMVVVALAALVIWAWRSTGGDSGDTDATPAPTTAANPCPVDAAICDFAKRVEYEYREGDPRTLLSPKSQYYPESGVLMAGTERFRGAPLLPRVMSIGCPIDPSVDPCAEAFSLVLTAQPDDAQQERISRVLLGFRRDGSELPIVTINMLVGGVDVVARGGDTGECRMSGLGVDAECAGTRFYPYTTGAAVAASPTPPPAPTPSNDPLAGARVVELTPGMQSSIGYDTIVYYSTGCFACGRPRIPNLYRAYRDYAGELQIDDLFGPLLTKSGGYPNSVAADWDRGHFLVQVCATGYCGGEAEPSPDATVKLYRSRDGGVSWVEEPAPDFPVEAWLAGFAGGEAIVQASERRGLEYVQRYFLFPSNTPLTPPPDIGTAAPFPDLDGGLGWLDYSPTTGFYDSSGKLLVPTSPGRRLVLVRPLSSGRLAHWAGEGTGEETFGVYHPTGELAGVFRSMAFAEFVGQLPSGLLIANVQLAAPFGFGVDGGGDVCKQSQPVYPSLVNWATGTVHPVVELGDCDGGAHKFVNAIVARPVLRVTTPGDCLNLRAEPSTTAPALGCFADGVLLPRWVEGAPAPVSGWLPVFSPGFEQHGWVAEEFVAR